MTLLKILHHIDVALCYSIRFLLQDEQWELCGVEMTYLGDPTASICLS